MRPSLPPRLALPTVLTIAALAAVAVIIAVDLGPVPALAALGIALLSTLWTLVSVRQMVLAPMVDLATHFTAADGGNAGGPVDVQHLRERGDAIGAIATALLDHQARVQQLTAEQAVQADGLATSMTDVARRGLALINRMLDRLAAMQQDESDAERLEALYALDHLAVRLRGQSENLLVVADTAPTGDPDEAPMRMVDLVRLAGSQTEDYTRVTVESAASVAVVGWASRPLAQLLAALLDNALRYSPPDQPAVVTSQQVPEGVIISIRDRGIGMDDEALQAAVQTIQAPPLLQAAPSRQLGLYVTGLLSQRLGTWVQLARAQDADGGILATVGVPSALLAVAPAMLLPEQPATPAAAVQDDVVETTRAAEARRLAAAAELLLSSADLGGPSSAVAPPAQPAGALPTRPGEADQPARPTYPIRPLPAEILLPDVETERGERRRRKQKAAASWSMSFPGAAGGTAAVASTGGGGLASFVNDKLTPRRRQPADDTPPQATAADQLSSRPLFVEVGGYTPPSLSEPADYIPDLVDNPLLDVLPEHPTAHLTPVLPMTAELRAGAVDLPTVLDGIRMADSRPDEPTGPLALPTRAPRTTADEPPVARLFADLVGDGEDDDLSQFSALAGLVAADPEGTS